MQKQVSLPGFGKFVLLFILVGALTQVPLVGLAATILFWIKGRPMLQTMRATQLADTEGMYRPMPLWSYKAFTVLLAFMIASAVVMNLLYGVLIVELASL